jgi:diguanylate cyclase (GGDEF)-like protein
MVVCDLDGLRLINDTLGHEQGDRQLVDVADLLQRCFRPEDRLARIGGDEFAAILPDVDGETLTAICRKISQEVDEYNLLLPNARLSLAVGHALRDCPADMHTLFIEAENEMYRQKQLRDGNSSQFILDGMFQSVEARDYFDDGHPQRVEDYAVRLAAILGLGLEQTEKLRLLSRYHDIGKVGLDERIVMKPGRLSADERQEVAQHCAIGCRIARCVPALAPVADLILKHHEQWDGSGYPLGLKYTDIPLECRILAIADAYEVMTAGRPYRHALTKAEAIVELHEGAGTQFDPELLKAFLPVLESEPE